MMDGMDMIFCPLYSGSSGNALFVQYGGTRLLIDAGKNGKTLTGALQLIGVDPATLDGILITHEHSDHIAGAGVMCRRYHIPVYATKDTWLAMEGKVGDIPPGMRRVFDKRQDFYLKDIGVVPFAIPHDAADPVGYRLWGGQVSIATATDLGYFAKSVRQAVGGSSLVLLESNHDPDMLMRNPHYSAYLKQRILGCYGHLSNESCAQAMLELMDTGVHHIILGHLSGENNTPELALSVAESRAEEAGIRLGKELFIDLAWRDRVGGIYTLREGA
ncbi:MAG: MBL fold metallo-hydrolase [Aristaeellaceae bacterium]